MQVSGKQPTDCIGNKMETYRKTLESYCIDYNLAYDDVKDYLNDDEELCNMLDYVEMYLSCDQFDDFLEAFRQYQ